MPESGTDLKDAMSAIVGAAVALAGLLLIFSGFLFGQAATFPPDTSDKTIDAFKSAARGGLVPFAFALVLGTLAITYWLFPNRCFAIVVIVLFIILSLATIAYGFWATKRL